ncbi:MAG: iron ABC transporter permease [Microbacterium sp.]
MTVSPPALVSAEPDLRLVHRGHGRGLRIIAMGVLMLLVSVISLGLGTAVISPATTAQILAHHLVGWPGEATWTHSQETIILDIRLPRVLTALLAGAALSIAGATLQSVVRNPLADPYILGVSAGASTGAAAFILFGTALIGGVFALSASAFVGASLATAFALTLAHVGGRATSTRLLLAGVTVGYLLSAATSFMVFASDSPDGARSVMFWLLGSIALATSTTLPVLGIVVVVGIVALTAYGRKLDALDLGDETAATLGVNPARLRTGLLLVCAALVGVTVAAVGSIGFVGLVVPHLARRMVGASHRTLLPTAAMMGAAFLVVSDVAARMALPPQELPIGIVTALVGTPLLVRHVARLREGAA